MTSFEVVGAGETRFNGVYLADGKDCGKQKFTKKHGNGETVCYHSGWGMWTFWSGQVFYVIHNSAEHPPASGWEVAKSFVKAPPPTLSYTAPETTPAPTPAAEAPAAASYKCRCNCQIHAGFEMDSDKTGRMAYGDVIDVLETRVNENGILRIRFSDGWVSERTEAGFVCWEALTRQKLRQMALDQQAEKAEKAVQQWAEKAEKAVQQWALQAVQAGAQKANQVLSRREGWLRFTVQSAEQDAKEKGGALKSASTYATNAAQSAAAAGEARAKEDAKAAAVAAAKHVGQEAQSFLIGELRRESRRAAEALAKAEAEHDAQMAETLSKAEAQAKRAKAAHDAQMAETLAKAEAEREAQVRQVAVSGLVQGLGYLSTRTVDLSAIMFDNVDMAQLCVIAGHCPDLEALFLPQGTQLDEHTLAVLRRDCPQALCLELGCELSQDGYFALRVLGKKHNAELAAALELQNLSEGVPPSEKPDASLVAKLVEIGFPENGSKRAAIACGNGSLDACMTWVLNHQEDADFNDPLEEQDGLCCVLDMTDRLFSRLTDAGFAEIPKVCPNATAVFLPSDSKITSAGLAEFQRQIPGVRCLALGAELQRAPLLRVLSTAMATQTLDLTRNTCRKLTTAGLRELAAICQPRDPFVLKAVIASQQLHRKAADGLAELQSLHPSAHLICVGDEVQLRVREYAVEAKEQLDRLQEQLKSAAEIEPAACEARNAARQQFVAAAEEYSAAFAEGSALASHLANLTENGSDLVNADGLSDLQKWRHVRGEAEQLIVLAAECKHVVESLEPQRSTRTLTKLQAREQEYRQALKTCQARIDIVEGEVGASPRSRHTVSATPEQQQARNALLEKGMSSWSEEQVQEWIGLLGLAPDRALVVQKALAADDTDGEDLEELTQKQWTKRLKKSGVENYIELAEQTVDLHEQALGGAPGQDKLAAAQADLAAARKGLRDTRLAMRSQVVHLVSLASRHFPELKEHPEVIAFVGSDGLEASDRRKIADYDEVKPLITGRNEVLRARYDGADVCLKVFPLSGDMGAYKREFLRVQRLRHPYIIKYTTAFEDLGAMYLEMQYYRHGSLRNWLETTQPDAAKKRSVLRQMLLALACVHSQGIVHSDIKGENVLIADDGSPRICDFEMSKDIDTISVSIAAGGGGFTPGFMCPRVLRGVEKLSPATDMYAFGVVILNTIHPPAQSEVYPLQDTTKLTDPALKDIVPKLLSDDPKTRPTALELQAEPYFSSDVVDEWGRIDVGQRASTKSCRQELLDADADVLGVPEIATVVAEVDVHMSMLGDDLTMVQRDHRFAFFSYSMESNVYRKFNSALRTRAGPAFEAWAPYLWHLSQALQALPDVSTTVYRGMNAPNLAEYKQSRRVHWSGFSSTSTNASVANEPPFYYGPPGVVFKLTVQNAKNIQPFSVLQHEEELLLSPNMEFLVTKELHEPTEGPLRGCRVIEMQQIPDDTLWS